MISDEGGYAYVAQRWLDERGTLYDDLWVSRPQGIFLAYGLIFHTIGESVVALRIGAWIVALMTMVVVWLLGHALGGRRVAMLATLLFALIGSSPSIEGFTANAEVFMALPAAIGAYLLLRQSRNGWTWHGLLLVGAMCGFATLLKPSGLVMLPVAIGFAFLATNAGTRTVFIRALWLSGGFVIAMLPAFIHGAFIGWDNFVFAAITYRITHQSTATNGIGHHAEAIWNLFARVWPLVAAVLVPFAFRWWAERERVNLRTWRPRLTSATEMGIVSRIAVRPPFQRGREGRLLLGLWFLGCLAGIAMGGDWWFHYLIQLAVPLSLWLAIKIIDVRAMLSPRSAWLMVIAIGALLLLPYNVIAKGDGRAITREIYGHPGYPDQMPVARYLMENTPPETPIFVAFDQAALYYLADRPSIYRYLYDQELRALPNSQAELIAIIESPNRPMYIVGTRQIAPFPDRGQAFWAAVARNYHFEADIRGVHVYRANAPEPRNLTPDL